MLAEERRPRRHSFWLRILGAAAILYVAGFFVFTLTLPAVDAGANLAPAPQADAIVALTGGGERLGAAVALLESGAGQRLLITGVHPQTTKEKLKALLHGGARFDCCADLGFAAADTRGNAREAALWARTHGYKSLIVVTAAYHMPRSLLEFGAAMPDVVLHPYAVEFDAALPPTWWRGARTLRILNGEYVKYAASLVRVLFEQMTVARDTPAMTLDGRAEEGKPAGASQR